VGIEPGSVVFRGLDSGGKDLAAGFCGLLGEIAILHEFTIVGRDRGKVVNEFVRGSEGILFEIVIGPGVPAAAFGADELLIAAESSFRVESIQKVEQGGLEFPVIRLEWVGTWPDGDGDRDREPEWE
jgi:hypothetical protein